LPWYATNGVRSLREMAALIRTGAQRALELDPGEIAPRFLLGAIAAGLDFDWNAAAEHFRVAMASPAVSSEAHWAYASFYLNPLGRLEEAAAAMQRAVEQDPLHGSWRGIFSHHLVEIGKLQEATREIQKVLELEENHWIANHTLSYIYLIEGRFDEALRMAERAHQANPRHSMPTGLLAAALVGIGETDRARELFRQMGDSPTPIWGRVEYHLFCSEIEEAAAWYKR